jgi:hypothetical protein
MNKNPMINLENGAELTQDFLKFNKEELKSVAKSMNSAGTAIGNKVGDFSSYQISTSIYTEEQIKNAIAVPLKQFEALADVRGIGYGTRRDYIKPDKK